MFSWIFYFALFYNLSDLCIYTFWPFYSYYWSTKFANISDFEYPFRFLFIIFGSCSLFSLFTDSLIEKYSVDELVIVRIVWIILIVWIVWLIVKRWLIFVVASARHGFELDYSIFNTLQIYTLTWKLFWSTQKS